MNRISIVGASCTGKTTLGHQLAERLDGRAIDLDELNWEPGWQTAAPEVFVGRLESALEAPRWVTSGNYSGVQDKYLALADTVIWLDYSLPVIMSRAMRRTLRRVIRGELCCNGNRETWRGVFSRDSIFLWVLKTYRKRRKSASELHAAGASHFQMLRFQSPREAARWLETVAHQPGSVDDSF